MEQILTRSRHYVGKWSLTLDMSLFELNDFFGHNRGALEDFGAINTAGLFSLSLPWSLSLSSLLDLPTFLGMRDSWTDIRSNSPRVEWFNSCNRHKLSCWGLFALIQLNHFTGELEYPAFWRPSAHTEFKPTGLEHALYNRSHSSARFVLRIEWNCRLFTRIVFLISLDRKRA